MKTKLLVLIGAMVLLGGCANPEINRWFDATIDDVDNYADFAKTKGGPQVVVFSFVPTEASEPAKTTKLTDLQDHGQEAYIKAMDGRLAPSRDLREELGKSLGKSEDASKKKYLPLIPTKLDKTLVVSISKGLAAKPGDRLIWSMVEIVPKDKSYTFAGYTMASTKNEFVDIATIKYTRNIEIGGSLSPTFSGALEGGGEANAKVGASKQIDTSIKQYYTDLAVGIKPNLLQVIREGERNNDISGNTLVKLSLALNRYESEEWESGVVVRDLSILKDGAILPPAKASAVMELVDLPPARPLQAQVILHYHLRRITAKAETYTEGDDVVLLERGVSTSEQELASINEIIPPLWCIVVTKTINNKLLRFPVQVKHDLFKDKDLWFTDYNTASLFAEWLNQNTDKKIGEVELSGQVLKNVSFIFEDEKALGDNKVTAMRLAPKRN